MQQSTSSSPPSPAHEQDSDTWTPPHEAEIANPEQTVQPSAVENHGLGHGGPHSRKSKTLKTKSHSFITGDQTLDIRLTLDFLGKQKQANIVCLNGAAA